MPERVDVRRVMQLRREVRLRSMDGLINEAERLCALLGPDENSSPAAASGGASVRHLANMNLGQALWHIGAWMDQSRTKITVDPPLMVRLLGRLIKGKYMRGEIAAPYRHTEANDALLVPPPQTTAIDGLAKLKESIGNWQATERRAESPLFGKLSHEEWDLVQLRHAEWHLSFMVEGQR